MLTVRDMRESDLEVVGKLAEGLVRLHHGWDARRFFVTEDVAGSYRRYFRSQLGGADTLLLVAEFDGAVQGYLFGTHERGRDWERLLEPHGAVHDLFVGEPARQRGVARALLAEAAARFRAWGLSRVVLSSASGNTDGQTCFQQLGYRATMVEFTLEI